MPSGFYWSVNYFYYETLLCIRDARLPLFHNSFALDAWIEIAPDINNPQTTFIFILCGIKEVLTLPPPPPIGKYGTQFYWNLCRNDWMMTLLNAIVTISKTSFYWNKEKYIRSRVIQIQPIWYETFQLKSQLKYSKGSASGVEIIIFNFRN